MARRLPLIATLAAAAVGVLGGSAYAAYRRNLAEYRRRVRAGSRIAETSLGPIEYGVEGAGPPALIIHGAGGGYDQGLLIARSLQQARIIAPSRFGYLGTPLPADGSPAAQADAHAALLDNLGIDSAIVAGASAGAPSAIELALRHPERVRALILLVPRGYSPDRPVEVPLTPTNRLVLQVVLTGADFAFLAALRLARSWVVRFMGVPPELERSAPVDERKRITEIMEAVLPLSARLAGIRNDSETPMKPLPLERISAPTLIVTSRDDLFGTLPAAELMAAGIPGAKLVVLDKGGHLFVGRHHEVIEAITDFLAGVAAEKGKVRPLRRQA
jgi:2-hydroxy-6-oxonona-2,4-dienedioate hydrolase